MNFYSTQLPSTQMVGYIWNDFRPLLMPKHRLEEFRTHLKATIERVAEKFPKFKGLIKEIDVDIQQYKTCGILYLDLQSDSESKLVRSFNVNLNK